MDLSSLFQNPNLKNISPQKLQFLMELANNNSGKTPQDMMSTLMAASAMAQKSGVQFNSDERSLIIEVLKQNMSENDRKKADMILNLMNKNKKG